MTTTNDTLPPPATQAVAFAPRPTGRTYHATGHCAEQAATERRRALISELLAATGLTPEAAIDIILTSDNVAHNWREAVSL